MAELGGLGKQTRRLGAIAQPAASGHVEQGKGEHGIAVAASGRETVPFHRFGIVLGDADSAG